MLYDQGLQDLSEQWLVDCNTQGWGCSGGWFAFSELYDGTPLETQIMMLYPMQQFIPHGVVNGAAPEAAPPTAADRSR